MSAIMPGSAVPTDTRTRFGAAMATLAQALGDRALDGHLQAFLNTEFGPASPLVAELQTLVVAGHQEGWLLPRAADGIAFGRPIKPHTQAGRFSVDVVRMEPVKGPHHRHPQGEIGLILPITGTPTFDGVAAGWYVYPPGSQHHPTVADGVAYILYLLPEGSIEFTGQL